MKYFNIGYIVSSKNYSSTYIDNINSFKNYFALLTNYNYFYILIFNTLKILFNKFFSLALISVFLVEP